MTTSCGVLLGCLALPKLNLQFLTLHDYLLRNFNLFRLESTCNYGSTTNFNFALINTEFISLPMCWFSVADEIRQDIEDAVFRMKPWRAEEGNAYFGGWARMALPIRAFSVVEVSSLSLCRHNNSD